MSRLAIPTWKSLRCWLAADAGGMATIFAIAAPVVFAAVWLGVNIEFLVSQRGRMQTAADVAALTAARQMSLSNVSVASIQQIALATAAANMPANPDPVSADSISTNVDTTNFKVTVSISRDAPALIANLYTPAATLSVSATATYKSSPICVLTLAGGGAAYDSKAASSLTANGCAIVSNSTASNGVTGQTSGTVSATKTCSAGGYVGSAFNPTPITDCPVVADPLAVRSPPSNAQNGCDHSNFAVNDTGIALTPGVYCGGINIKHGPAVFTAGDYIIRGGSLTINAGGSMVGTDVGFYLTGGAVLNAKPNSALSLSAPSSSSDPMVGLVFWEDPNNMAGAGPATHVIDSDNGQNLHGTVYFPNGNLTIGGHANVGSASAYTIIVALNLLTDQQANVVLNSNYMASAIPAPTGLGNTAGAVKLSQ